MKLFLLVLTAGLILAMPVHGKMSASFQKAVVEPTQRRLNARCPPDDVIPCTNKQPGTLCVNKDCLVGCCVTAGGTSTCVVPNPADIDAVEKCIIPCKTRGFNCQDIHGGPSKCTRFKCTDSVGFPVDLGPFDDGCVAVTPINDDFCDNTNKDDCKQSICSPLNNFTCVEVNEPQGEDCKEGTAPDWVNGCCFEGACTTDDNVCSYVEPCLGADGKPVALNLTVAPVVTYNTSALPSNLVTNYSDAALAEPTAGKYPIKMTFGSNINSIGINASYAAIIYDDANCNGNILGVAGSPHYALQYRPPYTGPHYEPPYPFNSIITNPTSTGPVLNIPAFPKLFYNPHYTQDFACLDEQNNPIAKCGKLEFCVEFQMLDQCNRKLNFVDVNVEIVFDLIEQCEEEFCGEVILQRNKVVQEDGEVELGSIRCFPCAAPSITVGQGSAVDLCIDVQPNVPGVCVYDILTLQLEITRPSLAVVTYPILPQGLSLVAYPGGTRSNPDYQPDYPPTINTNDATVQFLMPGEEFQELNPLNVNGVCDDPPCYAAARVRGRVLLGLGCYCKDPKPTLAQCATPLRNRLRGLQEEDDTFTAVDFEATVEIIAAAKVEETSTCGDLFCLIFSFLKWLLSLLTFGLL